MFSLYLLTEKNLTSSLESDFSFFINYFALDQLRFCRDLRGVEA